ncbi:ATP-dependent DNA helicase DDX11-like [Centruroides sculpturatus]|uniref:ATP-dependent DNA helicase DDX11-like n=1 Tax=Centruroides sculpturatus TaxID=218467 RepID=UPI000C6E49F0|nr:ATP-dependent DNA helicase DDX11-like [Centruroides sculpturatus]XP_023236751.1 ATP-dependent DNA helicase DDX11-like [Centruroides sculpturatus]
MNGPAKSTSKFPFPFTPYDVQLEFMSKLYNTLEDGKIGIFESPTGTGKSLSLICGAVTWLKEHEKKKKEELQNEINLEDNVKEDESDWFASFAKKKEQMDKVREAKSEMEYIEKREKRFKELKQQIKRKRVVNNSEFDELFKNSKHLKETVDNDLSDKDNEDVDILLLDYASDDESREENGEEEEERDTVKIYYCSRTHSQLSQFVREVRRSPYASDVRVISLGSRQNLCINEAVLKMKSLSLINEKCLDMQKNKKSARMSKEVKDLLKASNANSKNRGSCPYYRHVAMEEMRDRMLVEVDDIEEIVEMGKRHRVCPYYSSRYGVGEAELVVLPYNMLLHKQTRLACGIKLKGNIVIIDEAHNLLETINNIHSSVVSGAHLANAYSQLHQYFQRFKSRLHAKNLMYVKQILFILSAFIKHLGGNVDTVPTDILGGESQTNIYSHVDFLSLTQIDNINLFKILKYCEVSQISQKLHSFVGKYQVTIQTKQESNVYVQSSITNFLSKVSNKGNAEINATQNLSDDQIPSGSPFVLFQEFLRALTNPSNDGRVLSIKQENLQKSSLKFLLLNPALQFRDIVSECKSVIVAGGTMQPTSDFVEQLFVPAGTNVNRLVHFSCGHVIPPENLLGIALSQGPTGKPLDFTFQSRESVDVMDELGRVITNISSIVPGGIVCFFPSYDYEQKVYSHWDKTGFIFKLNVKKKIFREPKKSSLVDQVLADYSRSISQSKNTSSSGGSILFSVVGGKMSEGINFSDDLGRCIVMVGLPYPNINSPELKEKMNYLNTIAPKAKDGRLPGQVYYENICMKAVNQSIGRAIRHKDDYAIILLLDGRYLRPSVTSALPMWISSRLTSYPKFNQAFSAMRQFYADKNN